MSLLDELKAEEDKLRGIKASPRDTAWMVKRVKLPTRHNPRMGLSNDLDRGLEHGEGLDDG